MKKLALVMIIALALTWLISCDSTSTTVTSNNPNTVRMEGTSFNISSITISKGSTITFLDDPNNGALHILVVGQDGQQNSEQGAADFGGLSGQKVEIGSTWTTPPWNTAGTYHITCTVHPLMNLTVKVTG